MKRSYARDNHSIDQKVRGLCGFLVMYVLSFATFSAAKGNPNLRITLTQEA